MRKKELVGLPKIGTANFTPGNGICSIQLAFSTIMDHILHTEATCLEGLVPVSILLIAIRGHSQILLTRHFPNPSQIR